MSRDTLDATPKHEQLDDERLSVVNGGSGKSPHPGGTSGGGGNGTGGGDGLGWLRNLVRAVDKALRF